MLRHSLLCLALLCSTAASAGPKPPLNTQQAIRLIAAADSFRPVNKRDGMGLQALRFIGSIHSPRNRYDLYFYNYHNPISLHGRQGLLVIRNARVYLGGYDFGADGCSVRRRTVKCWDGDYATDTEFPGGEPPAFAHLAGERVELSR